MATGEQSEREAVFHAENVGGIEETRVSIPPGVTVLSGKNATNRTSFLQAIMAACGSDQATLKGDATEGRVRLRLAGDSYERILERRDGEVRFSGEGYLDEPGIADLFAFLLESNEARRAVARGENLRDLIMRPVDVDRLEAEIDRLEGEKGDVNDELATIESLKRDLPDLERRREDLEADIADERERLQAKEAEIEAASADLEEAEGTHDRLDERFAQLREKRSDLESVRYDIEAEKESIQSLTAERNELGQELSELPDEPDDTGTLEERIETLRNRKQRLESGVQTLQRVIGFNEDRLDGGRSPLVEELASDEAEKGEGDGDSSVTDALVEDTVVCWTCGSEVEPGQVRETLDRLRELRGEKLDEMSELESELDSACAERRSIQQRQREAERLKERRADVEAELERRRETVDRLEARKAELSEEVEALEAEVEELEAVDPGGVLDLHKEANRIEFDIERLESNLSTVEERIAEVEETISREPRLRERREELLEELEDRRTRIDRIEADAVEQFNTHMEAILDLLGYENLERVWIERRDGNAGDDQPVFELHVVRSTRSGAVYEDTVDHLSESEREVTGLIFGLAGYLVHDLHERVPFMLLDSLEAIDSNRIAALVEYFAEYADYLVVALLPEDAQALDDSYTRVSDI